MKFRDTTEVLRVIRSSGEMLNVHDSHAENLALFAHAHGFAAFASTEPGHHNQAAIGFVYAANEIGAVEAAKMIDDAMIGPRSRAYLLRTLIPLNPEAREELKAASGHVFRVDVVEASAAARKEAMDVAMVNGHRVKVPVEMKIVREHAYDVIEYRGAAITTFDVDSEGTYEGPFGVMLDGDVVEVDSLEAARSVVDDHLATISPELTR